VFLPCPDRYGTRKSSRHSHVTAVNGTRLMHLLGAQLPPSHPRTATFRLPLPLWPPNPLLPPLNCRTYSWGTKKITKIKSHQTTSIQSPLGPLPMSIHHPQTDRTQSVIDNRRRCYFEIPEGRPGDENGMNNTHKL
jgi:hypothetical protein